MSLGWAVIGLDRLRGCCLILGLALAIGAAATFRGNAVGAESPREAALAELRSADAAARVRGCHGLAQHGLAQDLPLLLKALHDSSTGVREASEAAIWYVWSRSGDAAADRVFEQGVAQMHSGELRTAAATFGRVIAMRPQFAEAWNKRATVYFLLGEDELSLHDCDEVLKRNPQHFGVLAGYGQIHARGGDLELALDYFKRALAINPNMEGVRVSVEVIQEILAKRSGRYI